MDDIFSLALKKRPVFTVSELGLYLKRALGRDALLRRLTVSGEISGIRRYSSGHLYFTLKDDSAALRCVMFSRDASSLSFEPGEGMTAEVDGQISFYEKDGLLQLYATDMRPAGAGALYMAFEKLKEKLAAEGLFDADKKKPLPFLPRRIAVVTSPDGAALHDIIIVSKRRCPGLDILLVPSLVQGADAPASLAAAIALADKADGVELLIVGRGGGSIEDLQAFNTEVVARAIFACSRPVISAVGHETDYSIADFVADLRAPTPSAAAELAAPDASAVRAALDARRQKLHSAASRQVAGARLAIAAKAARLMALRPDNVIMQRRARVQSLSGRLVRAAESAVTNGFLRTDSLAERLLVAAGAAVDGRRRQLEQMSAGLLAMNPEAVYKRGYAAVLRDDGSPVKSAASLGPCDSVALLFADGKRGATID